MAILPAAKNMVELALTELAAIVHPATSGRWVHEDAAFQQFVKDERL